MKRIILLMLFLLISIIGVYFYYSNKKIEGLYIKDYEIRYFKNGKQYITSNEEIVEIKNQKFYNYISGFNQIPVIYEYFSYGNTIKLAEIDTKNEFTFPFNFKIENINTDSIIFNNAANNIKYIYKRIPKSLKNTSDLKVELVNKSFELIYEKRIDTIFFDKNSLLIKNDLNPDNFSGWDFSGWEYNLINGFHFLNTGYGVVFILQKKDENLFLYRFDNERGLIKLQLDEIKIDYDKVKKIISNFNEIYNK